MWIQCKLNFDLMFNKKVKINNIKKEVQHEIEFAISKSKYPLTKLILKATVELLTINLLC